jgi:hypothetical protein
MQYLVTATALEPTDDGSFVIVEIPQFILDSEMGVTEENVFDKAREIIGDPKHVKLCIMNYHPRSKV